MSRYAYLAFFAGFVGSGIYRGLPPTDIAAGSVTMAVLLFALHFIVERLITAVAHQTDTRKDARALRNRAPRIAFDNSGVKLRNKGHINKHMRWIKK